jgi:flavin-dependent thymidylate synthase
MHIKLISYTPDAAELLIFTKSTRLQMNPNLLEEIKSWPEEKKMAELKYMANTIPSSWEFADFTFLITGVSRAFTHQFVRTRQGSYAQQTMRLLNVGEYEYVETSDNPAYKAATEYANRHIKLAYNEMVAAGVPIEDARGILPTNISTNIVAKFNLRTLSELCKSRTGGRTQDEYRRVMQGMADAVLAVYPWAEMFLFPAGRDHFEEIEKFAKEKLWNQPMDKADLLKIVDKMRKQ